MCVCVLIFSLSNVLCVCIVIYLSLNLSPTVSFCTFDNIVYFIVWLFVYGGNKELRPYIRSRLSRVSFETWNVSTRSLRRRRLRTPSNKTHNSSPVVIKEVELWIRGLFMAGTVTIVEPYSIQYVNTTFAQCCKTGFNECLMKTNLFR